MLPITIPEQRLWDESTEEFVNVKETHLQMEHSLISLAKWESKWHKPFLDKKTKKTDEEYRDYFRCMTLTQNVDPAVYRYMSKDTVKKILDYIDDPMTATWFSENKNAQNGAAKKQEVITAEIIYYWMVTLNIPVQFEKWHLNRLITLIRVINAKNTPPKKMSKRDTYARNTKMNAVRRAAMKSRG
jgi:hypothetical protein